MNLFDLVAKISLDDKAYTKGISGALKAGQKMGAGVANGAKVAAKALAGIAVGAGVAAAALSKIVMKSVDYGDSIDEESQKLNMSTDAYQKWSIMLKQGGTSIDSMGVAMKTFTGILDEAKNGNTDALLTLKKLGLGYEDFEGLSVEDSLKKVVEQFQSMDEGAAKTQLAIDLFGRGGQELLPVLNAEKGSIDKLFTSYEDLGLIMSEEAIKNSAEFADKVDLLKQKATMLAVNFGSKLLPVFDNAATKLLGFAKAGGATSEELTAFFTEIVVAAVNSLPKIAEMASKIIPTIINTIIATLPALITAAVQIIDILAKLLVDNLPILVPAVLQIITKIIDTITSLLPILLPSVILIIQTIAQGLVDNLPAIAESIVALVDTLVDTIIKLLPVLIPAAVDVIMTIVQGLIDNLPAIIDAAILLVVSVANGLLEALPNLIPAAVELVLKIVKTLLDNLPMLIDVALDLILALVDGLIAALPEIIEMAPQIIDSIVKTLIVSIPKLIDAAVKIIDALVSYILDPKNITDIINMCFSIMTSIGKGLLDAVWAVVSKIPSIITKIKDKFFETDWGEIGLNILKGIGTGLEKFTEGIANSVQKVGQNIYDGFVDFFDIGSPAKKMKPVGKFIVQGVGVGAEKEMPSVTKKMKASMKELTTTDDLVNGFMGALKLNSKSNPQTTNVAIKIGDKEIKDFIMQVVNKTMELQGLKPLAVLGKY